MTSSSSSASSHSSASSRKGSSSSDNNSNTSNSNSSSHTPTVSSVEKAEPVISSESSNSGPNDSNVSSSETLYRKKSICNLPDQTIRSLSIFLTVAFVMKILMAITIFAVALIVKSEANRIIAIQVGAAVVVSTAAGAYGVYHKDRGWLLLCLIVEIYTLCAVTPFLAYTSNSVARLLSQPKPAIEKGSRVSDASLYSFLMFEVIGCVVVFLLTLATAWLNRALFEKIQSKHLERSEFTADHSDDGGCNWDFKHYGLSRWIVIVSLICLAGVAAIYTNGGLLESGNMRARMFILASTGVLPLVMSLYGALVYSREMLGAAFVGYLFVMAQLNSLLFRFFLQRAAKASTCKLMNEEASAECYAKSVDSLNGAIFLYFFMFVISVALAWLCSRLEEELQIVERRTFKAGFMANWCTSCSTSTMGLVRKVYAMGVVFLLCAAAMVGVGYASKVRIAIVYHLFFAIVLAVIALLTLYSAYARDTGFLDLLFIFVIYTISVLYDFVTERVLSYSVGSCVPSRCGTDNLVYAIDLAVGSLVVLCGFLLAYFAHVLGERIQDREAVSSGEWARRSATRNKEYSNSDKGVILVQEKIEMTDSGSSGWSADDAVSQMSSSS